jgi:hypothetical protein
MAWWRRVALGVLDSYVGQSVLGVIAALVVFGVPGYFFGATGFLVVVGFLLGCACGYDFARREWRRKGYVPKV